MAACVHTYILKDKTMNGSMDNSKYSHSKHGPVLSFLLQKPLKCLCSFVLAHPLCVDHPCTRSVHLCV